MYNGIGLTTARGSGTNGYVVRNLSHVRPPPIQNKQKGMDHRGPPPPVKKPNKELILHDLKRKVEVQCMELRLSLEDDGVDETTIDTKVDALRQSLLSRLDDMKPREAKSLQEHETHLLQAAKAEENIKFANAFGIRHQDHVEGQAFDRELQEQKKQERMERRRLEMEKQMERHERDEKAARRRDGRRRSSRDDDRRRRRRRSPSYSSASSRSSSSDSDHHNRRRRSRSRSVSSASSSGSESGSESDRGHRSSKRQRRSRSPSSSGSYSSDDSRVEDRRNRRRRS